MVFFQAGVFQFDRDSRKSTLWHRLAPRTRVLCAGLMVLAIAFTPNGHWWTWATYALAIIGLVFLSRVTIGVLIKRVAIEFCFIGTVLLGTLFNRGGDVIWQWGWLSVTDVGLTILGSVAIKSTLCLLTLNLLTLTTPVPALLQSLVQLRVPPLLVAILASMYRYIGVLVDEFTAMGQAANSRNLRVSSGRRQRSVIGNMFGSLFIRTYERGERVHQAMLARGYGGLSTMRDLPAAGRLDVMALTAIALVMLLGQALYLHSYR